MKALDLAVLLSILAILAILAGAVPAPSQQQRESRKAEPPSISYGGSRTSTGRIEIADGSVFVDEGVAWKGVKVYLSLDWRLVAVDEASGKALWAQNVGAFWNGFGFKEVETAPGTKTWAVELRPDPTAHDGADLRQYHDLKTGERVAARDEQPKGT